jgi:hypothetical protein
MPVGPRSPRAARSGADYTDVTTTEFADRHAFRRAALDLPTGRLAPCEAEEFRAALDVASKLVAQAKDDATSRYWRGQVEVFLVVVEAAVAPRSRPT